jgi:hypothetical protein
MGPTGVTPAGAAAGIANVIVKEETGKDFAGNAFALASGETIHWRKSPEEIRSENPEKRLGDALAGKPPLEDLPVSLLAFTIVIIGGLGSLRGAIAGGLLIGVSEAIAGFLLEPSLKSVFSFALLILVLLIRPQGLFGKAA